MITQASSAQDAGRSMLIAGENIQFCNMNVSSQACFRTFVNGHAMGTTALGSDGMGTVDEYLLPEQGMIMSTGDLDRFCINDSDVETTQWGTPGDEDLTSIASRTNQDALTYDACLLDFEFRCDAEVGELRPCRKLASSTSSGARNITNG